MPLAGFTARAAGGRLIAGLQKRAGDDGAVDRFHEAALRSGGRDNGAPGLRAHYGPHYYAAFVVDADGHAIEAVFNAPV